MSMTPEDFLMGRGGTSAKWEHLGATVTGTVTRKPEVNQQTEFVKGGGVGKPKFFDNGDPMYQMVVQLQTSERDPANPQDSGVRNIFVKGKAMTQAVRAAVQVTAAPGLEVGGTLALTWTGGGPRFPGDNDGPPREWAAQYWRPAQTNPQADQFLNGGPVPGGQQYPPQQYAQQAYQQPPAAPPQQYAPGFAPQPAFGPPAGQPAYAPQAQQAYQAPPQQTYQPPAMQRPANVPEDVWQRADPQQQAAIVAAAGQAAQPAAVPPPF